MKTLFREMMKQQKVQDVANGHKQVEQEMLKMRKFYDYERFDIDYLGDAVLFSKADQPPQQN